MQDITSRFGSRFVSFLETNDTVMDLAKVDSLTYPISLDMPPAERSFIVETSNSHPEEAVREGGRIAYLAIFESPSWEEEKKRLTGMLAIPRRRSRCDCPQPGRQGRYSFTSFCSSRIVSP